jgi:hypothetical protein
MREGEQNQARSENQIGDSEQFSAAESIDEVPNMRAQQARYD